MLKKVELLTMLNISKNVTKISPKSTIGFSHIETSSDFKEILHIRVVERKVLSRWVDTKS